MFQLSLFRLVGGYTDNNTPKIITDRLQKYYKTEDLDSAVEPGAIDRVITKDSLSKIAYYINMDRSILWDRNSVLFCFDRLLKFSKQPSQITHGFSYGEITPSQTGNYNILMLYRILKYNNVPISRNCSEDDIIILCRKLSDTTIDPKNAVIRGIYDGVINRKVLMELYVRHNLQQIDEGCETYDKFIEILESTYTMRYRILPKNRLEAIALSAYNYSINISDAEYPIDEYIHIQKSYNSGEDLGDYKPKDEKLVEIMKKSNYYLFLDSMFNPSFPEKLYAPNILNDLIKNEFYDDITDTNYNMLMLGCTSYTFYEGLVFNYSKETMVYRHDVDTLDPSHLVSYGIYGENMVVFTYEELINTFVHHQFFKNPSGFGEQIFSDRNINKLLSMVRKFWFSAESGYIMRKSYEKSLTEIVNTIRDNIKLLGDIRYDFSNYYKSVNSDSKDLINNILIRLFKISMYMRGWMDSGDFPYHSERNNYPISLAIHSDSEYESITERVSVKITEFYDICNNIDSEIGHKILNMPLFTWYGGSLIKSTIPTDGLTIDERLKIVIKNETQESCIRTSSNWLAFTANAYMESVRLPQPFEMKSLRVIS